MTHAELLRSLSKLLVKLDSSDDAYPHLLDAFYAIGKLPQVVSVASVQFPLELPVAGERL